MRQASPKQLVRVTAGGIVVVCLLVLVGSFIGAPSAGAPGTGSTPVDRAMPKPQALDSPGDATGLTVISTQGFYVGNHPGDRNVAELIAVTRNGTVVYRDRSHGVYYDVDPVEGSAATVEYVAADRVGGDRCATSQCSRNVVKRVNLSTGEVREVYAAVTPKFDGGRWHDVDRVNATHIVIADIVSDRLSMVDLRRKTIVWQWNASERYPPTAGGGQQDWTHINDVEVLPDGRIMANLRNMDEVVFIDPSTGVATDWTLGTDDDHHTLYEPHNPDYLPADRGGPAVLIADSENNRVIEYQRRDGDWQQAWSWRDPQLQWPRDADRVHDGHTVIVDSHGNRVIEVAPNGSIVWSVTIRRPYDAERLGTGDESRDGFAAGASPNCSASNECAAPPIANHGPIDSPGPVVRLKDALKPGVVNGLLFIAPPWVTFTDLLVIGLLVTTLGVWGLLEMTWRWL